MPALNVEFTEEELVVVRALAAADGKSVKAYVHDITVREHARRVFVEGAKKFIDDHKEEFRAAFPDDAPAGNDTTAKPSSEAA
ncbi:hypothetical protein [Streptomyces beihaiensis]|uniref:Uncharacterized protein n=1 Tax=Streptomyces beihaiensis TaxID=2984495 RepID=A0ABT3TMU4_9ACTN|nr:hypothetical protein [Streptomyces beihaiensis]MCX3058364.1 hypothetical protein [Streptomyces beihaiensis]